MIDEKESVGIFFNYLYNYIQEIVQTDNKYNAKNLACFQKFYEGMVEAFANSEDAGCINWKRMWEFLSLLQIMDSGREGEKTEFSQYKDIDMFFGILYQCMMTFMTDDEANECNKTVIKNIFETIKENFKTSTYADGIPWDWMWQVFMNSKVYSTVVEKEHGGDNYWGKNMYSGDEGFFSRLINEDRKNKSYSSFVCVLKSDYFGFDIPNASGNDAMKGQNRRFKDIIRELDREGQIEKIFIHYKEGGKRPIWEVSAINAKAFYKEIDTMGPIGMLGFFEPAHLYSMFCGEDGYRASYESMKELIECFTEKGDRSDWYKEYKRLDRAAEILCQLVPIVSYEENGNRYIKTYSRWKEDCEKIAEIVHEKTLAFGIDQIEIKAAELVKNYIDRLSENEYEKRVQVCFKERYLDFLEEQSEKFFQSLDKVYWVLQNVDNEKDMHEMAKRAVETLDVK